ncbi:hypothetical protein SFRURICE_018930 [Spodoptera frugiperda]|nr:hypothetical protein SFRURICE_018930 [Spodoptera frugiperda]
MWPSPPSAPQPSRGTLRSSGIALRSPAIISAGLRTEGKRATTNGAQLADIIGVSAARICSSFLYAWGVPLVITGVVTCLDNIDITDVPYIVKPPFDDCFKNKFGIQEYYYKPLGVIMLINIVLFIMTIYHIMTTTNSTTKNAEFRRSGRENSYKTYMKLSLTMGISWILELIPNSDNTFLFILSNTYNSLIGVIIFFVYICDKNVLNELCKKFNIQNGFVTKLAHRKSLFRLARSMKVQREELTSMQTATTGLSSEAENKISCTALVIVITYSNYLIRLSKLASTLTFFSTESLACTIGTVAEQPAAAQRVVMKVKR